MNRFFSLQPGWNKHFGSGYEVFAAAWEKLNALPR